MTDKKISNIKPAATVEELETANLKTRRLHANALQMLVVMGKDLLTTQQTLLNAVAEMRANYEKFSAFIETNAAHLPDVDNNDPDNK